MFKKRSPGVHRLREEDQRLSTINEKETTSVIMSAPCSAFRGLGLPGTLYISIELHLELICTCLLLSSLAARTFAEEHLFRYHPASGAHSQSPRRPRMPCSYVTDEDLLVAADRPHREQWNERPLSKYIVLHSLDIAIRLFRYLGVNIEKAKGMQSGKYSCRPPLSPTVQRIADKFEDATATRAASAPHQPSALI